ncbi:MAG: Cdc6/Cdc18 family protein [Candidatus Hodarchaeota archaeon]
MSQPAKKSQIFTEYARLLLDSKTFPSMINQLPCRELQIIELGDVFHSWINNNRQSQTVLYGSPGTGIKSVIQYWLRQCLLNNSFAKSFFFAIIDCNIEKSFTKIMYRLIEDSFPNELKLLIAKYFDLTFPFPKCMTGSDYFQIFETCQIYFPRSALLVFDNFDNLSKTDASDLLYNLYESQVELHREHKFKHYTHVIVIVQNLPRFWDLLDSSTKSRFFPKRVVFPKYRKEELEAILNARTSAFYPTVLAPEVIPSIAEFVADNFGSARIAIDLLKSAAILAEKNQSKTINPNHSINVIELFQSNSTKTRS